jgi:hypothetical protein
LTPEGGAAASDPGSQGRRPQMRHRPLTALGPGSRTAGTDDPPPLPCQQRTKHWLETVRRTRWAQCLRRARQSLRGRRAPLMDVEAASAVLSPVEALQLAPYAQTMGQSDALSWVRSSTTLSATIGAPSGSHACASGPALSHQISSISLTRHVLSKHESSGLYRRRIGKKPCR